VSIVIAAVAVLIGAALQSATGFGFALVSAPALFAVLEPGAALTILVILSVALSILVLTAERRGRRIIGGDVLRLTAWSVPGLIGGVVLLGIVAKPVLQVAVGVAVVAAALVDLRAAARPREAGARAPTRWPLAPVGLGVGALTTTTGINGPPLLTYFQRAGADPHEVRDSLAACFLLLNPLAAVALAADGQLGLGGIEPLELVLLLVLVAVGQPVGRAVFLRLSPGRFRAVGVALAVAAGLASILAGALG